MSWDGFNDDALHAMDAAGMESAVLIGDREGGPATMLFAATYPDRVSGLVLVNTFARFVRADDYPIGAPPEVLDKLIEWLKRVWGSPEYFAVGAPSIRDDLRMQAWLARYMRLAVPPGAIDMIFDFHANIDVRPALAAIQAPTLVITRRDATHHRPEFGRYIADRITDATLVELPGADTMPFFLGDVDPLLDAIEEFVAGERTHAVIDRTLATVMFTDIVDSTRQASLLGDSAWLDLLEQHDRVARRIIERHRGRTIKSTGDGLLVTFDGPSRAVACASQLVSVMPEYGLSIRAGLHTGEIEVAEDGDVGGLAVHIAARVSQAIEGSGVVVSSTVRELVAGSGINFVLLGARELKGVPGTWDLFELPEPVSFGSA